MDKIENEGEIKKLVDLTPSITISPEQIKTLFKPYFDENQFEAFYFDYIANMIIEDQPDNDMDLRNLLEDYLSDKLRYSDDKAQQICKDIFEQLIKIGYKGERKAIIAEKLDRTVKLGQVKVGSENTITSLSFDPNLLTLDKDKLYTADMQVSKKAEYVIDDEKRDALKRHMEEMKKMKDAAPEVTMHHNRDESHKVDIIVENFTISIGGRTLMDEAQIRISYGRRYVLIGRNGIGKTTLLHNLARKEIEGVPKHLQILHVEQEVVATDNLLINEVLSCDKERARLLKELDEVNNASSSTQENDKALSDRIVGINKRLQEIDADEAETKAIEILRGLGFSTEDLRKPTKQFSGGWRMRISLAKALFVQPDILLLDEPTNHLDMNAVMWLEDYLLQWPYTLVVVSHARDFINNIATDIIHLTNSKLYYYKGNYTDFERSRSEKAKLMSKQKLSQDKKVEHMQSFIDKFRANAKRASLVQSRIKALNKIEMVEEILEDPTCIFVFPTPEKLNPPILRLDNVDLGYNKDQLILNKVNFAVDMSSRIAVVGPNGAGKTTLLKCLTAELNPLNGMLYRHNKLKLAMFTQHHVDQLDIELSPVEQISKIYSDLSNEVIRAHLASFGISGNLALRPIYLLSGGQKSRVALATIVFKNPQILLMDEPTNHLDIDAVNALAVALNSFTGGLVIVSHDQHFVESVCSQIVIVNNKKCTQFKGSFTDYKQYLRAGGK